MDASNQCCELPRKSGVRYVYFLGFDLLCVQVIAVGVGCTPRVPKDVKRQTEPVARGQLGKCTAHETELTGCTRR